MNQPDLANTNMNNLIDAHRSRKSDDSSSPQPVTNRAQDMTLGLQQIETDPNSYLYSKREIQPALRTQSSSSITSNGNIRKSKQIDQLKPLMIKPEISHSKRDVFKSGVDTSVVVKTNRTLLSSL